MKGPTGTGDAAGCVDHDAIGFYGEGPQKGGQGQGGGRRVAPGRGHQSGAAEGGTKEFGESVGSFGQQLRRTMDLSVPRRV